MPFALIYLLSPDGRQAHLASSCGGLDKDSFRQTTVNLADANAAGLEDLIANKATIMGTFNPAALFGMSAKDKHGKQTAENTGRALTYLQRIAKNRPAFS